MKRITERVKGERRGRRGRRGEGGGERENM